MRTLISMAVLSAITGSVVFAEPVITKGKLDAVTVYRGQAMVTRVVDLPKQAGLVELVITDLPQRVVPGSLFAEGTATIQVRSVLYRTRAVAQDVREEVRKLDDQIKAAQTETEGVRRSIEVMGKNAEYLAKLEQFVAPTAQTELTRGVLNAETLEKLTTLIFTRREQLAIQKFDAETMLASMNEKLELLQRQRAEITRGASDTAREAVVLLDAQAEAKSIKLNYLVDAATWTPSYTINASSGKPTVSVLYQAAIAQMSGEEWNDVTMTLSTATPSVISRAPKLEPLLLALSRDQQPQAQGGKDESGYVQQLKEKRQITLRNLNSNNGSVQVDGANQGGQFNFSGGGGGGAAVGGVIMNAQSSNNYENVKASNAVAQEMQMAEYKLRDKAAVKSLNKGEETITVTYQLPSRTTLQSRADQQLVSISSIPMKAGFYKLAVPVLTPYVYDEASVTNDSKTVLLSGPSVSYMNGQFVGHGDIPTTFVGGTFTAGFGIDASLRATRELVERTELTQGGNNVITFDYRLSVENFGDKPADIRLLDRMPKPDGNQLKPTLVSSSTALSGDGEYERVQKKQGLLRFDLTVPPQAVNASAKTVDYRLTIEHDRQMTISEAQ
ncbi:MAG: mucoidy inhibitor MuiA family protein [Burkholderiales bacterium]|nr:mucoidy inhibitor MuiA family protein [Phycisphaerae bacterium]